MNPLPRVPLTKLIARLDGILANMVEIEAERFPAHWTPDERRAAAERSLFGRAGK